MGCVLNWQPGGQSWAGAMSCLGFLPTGRTGAGSLKTVGQVRRSGTPQCSAPSPPSSSDREPGVLVNVLCHPCPPRPGLRATPLPPLPITPRPQSTRRCSTAGSSRGGGQGGTEGICSTEGVGRPGFWHHHYLLGCPWQVAFSSVGPCFRVRKLEPPGLARRPA